VKKYLLIYPPFAVSISLLKAAPRENFSKKTAKAVEGKVCPDRFSAVKSSLYNLSESAAKRHRLPISATLWSPKNARNLRL